MLRIIAGTKKGMKIEVPDSARPITDRIRTSIFDTIKEIVPEATVLDLYSGSGSFSIEALSRGASNSTIVEIDEEAIKFIYDNLRRMGLSDSASLLKSSVSSFLRDLPSDSTFDIIMTDPPFKLDQKHKYSDLELSANHLTDKGVIIFRFPSTETYQNVPAGLTLIYSKKFGVSRVNYYRKQ